MTTPEGIAGMVAQKTDTNTREVLDWFKEWFGEDGYETRARPSPAVPGGSFGGADRLARPRRGGPSAVTVAETSEDGTQVTINYNAGEGAER